MCAISDVMFVTVSLGVGGIGICLIIGIIIWGTKC